MFKIYGALEEEMPISYMILVFIQHYNLSKLIVDGLKSIFLLME
jgi:hypothetical protein